MIVLMFLLFYGIWALAHMTWGSKTQELPVSEFERIIRQHKGDKDKESNIKSVEFSQSGHQLKIKLKEREPDKTQEYVFVLGGEEHATSLRKFLKEQKVPYRIKQESQLLLVLLNFFGPILVMLLLFYFLFYRQLRNAGAGGNVLSFGKSRARLASKESTGVTFQDVAGIVEAKEEVTEIIEFLKNPQRFQRLGGRIPRGVLLVGPPGTGKTLLAKAIAGEAGVPFFSICGSDFVEMFVGVGASRVRDMFRQAKESSPCIIFLDEIDAVGRRRGHGWGGGHDEREQTLNAILVEMDGFETDTGIILLAATNRPDVLDPALLRPGRFDRAIYIDLPDIRGREDILKVHARKVKMSPDVDLSILARSTPTFSGAELEAVINEAALQAGMKDKDYIEMCDLEEARDKIRWGRQKHSRVMDEEEKKTTAIHESGHALVTKLLPEAEPLHKVTIIPRGPALGATMSLPEKDRYTLTRGRALATVKVMFAGKIAEELFCSDITSGAADDIKRATQIVRMMVREWGMSEKVGPINFADSEDKLYGGEVVIAKSYSESTAIEIDKEVKRIVDQCVNETRDLLKANADKLKLLSEALLKHESLDGEDVDAILAGRPLRKEKPAKEQGKEATEEAEKTPAEAAMQEQPPPSLEIHPLERPQEG